VVWSNWNGTNADVVYMRSTNGGASWSSPATLSTATSDVQAGNAFSFPNCAFNFIGDYSGITVDSSGVGHSLWTDIRADRFDPTGNADQDPFTATLTAG
jgi:hypothetical protein